MSDVKAKTETVVSAVKAKVETVKDDVAARVARLERVATIGHSVNLANYDDPEQKAAREKQVKADAAAETKANEKAAADAAKAAEAASEETA